MGQAKTSAHLELPVYSTQPGMDGQSGLLLGGCGFLLVCCCLVLQEPCKAAPPVPDFLRVERSAC
eukprot:9834587-Lingulodinium_polyedra.AAC.1